MANLTEGQQRAFGERIVELLGDADTADTGLDPAKRLGRLTPLQEKRPKQRTSRPRRRPN